MTPLTHHDILEIVEPFTRHGRHVDLAASDRAARVVVFKPMERPGAGPEQPMLRETLRLACREDGRYTLTRVLDHPAGLQATLQCAGTDRAALLARVDAIAPHHAFRQGPGWQLACNYEFAAPGNRLPAGAASPEAALVLTRGELRLEALTLVITLMAVRGVSGDLAITPAPGERLDLPEDLLAVQGWDWARLVPATDGWTSKLRLRGDHVRRSRTAERALQQVAGHLVRVLAEPPAQYHQRHLWARWGVVLRRMIPTLTAAMLIVAALLLPRVTREADAGWLMALHYVPIAVLAFSFTLQELPRFELPRWPRRPAITRWRRPAAIGV